MENKNLYIVVEGESDKKVLKKILDFSKVGKVFMYVTMSKNTMSSYVRTLRLMYNDNPKILVVFDSDVIDKTKAKENVETMRQLSGATTSRNVGFFAFVPDLDSHLSIEKKILRNNEKLDAYLDENLDRLKAEKIIKEIQAFVDKE